MSGSSLVETDLGLVLTLFLSPTLEGLRKKRSMVAGGEAPTLSQVGTSLWLLLTLSRVCGYHVSCRHFAVAD